MNLTEILNRRTDLSTFLVHLTRTEGGNSAFDNLQSIITSGTLEARSVFGHLAGQQNLPDNGDSQKVVCFTETPLEYTYFLTSDIENRAYHFEPYGIAITKRIGRRIGINPVWYVDITTGHDWLTNNLNNLRTKFLDDPEDNRDLERLFPFFEHMGNGTNARTGRRYCKEFWWEREWRIQGDLPLPERFLCLCPEEEIEEFDAIINETPYEASCIDPRWSLERIIAQLAGFKKSETEIL